MPTPDIYGEPSFQIASYFQLWVHGREFPNAMDDIDGNFLVVSAVCRTLGARVWIKNEPIVMITDFSGFASECASLHRKESHSAVLYPVEPRLRVSLEAADELGHIRLRIEITHDCPRQSHVMDFEIDQSYLPDIINQCEQIIHKYPIRGKK